MTDSHPIVVFIGGGNMARSLIGGLVAGGHPAAAIRVVEPADGPREALAGDFGIAAYADARDAVHDSHAWVLAVKPQVVRQVCESLAADAAREAPVVISVAAGITTAQIGRWLGGRPAVVRSMPNTPSLLGAGATGLYANAATNADQRELARTLFSAVGIAAWVDDERLIDAVTGIAGSAPAYFFLLAESLQQAGEAQGLPAETARALVIQTALGAARMLAETGDSAAVLRQRVTSPGGTTQAALDALTRGGLPGLVAGAVDAAARRGAELSSDND